MKRFRGRLIPEDYNELCLMWNDYFNKNGTYPNSLVCQTDKDLPAWSRVREICGDKFIAFCEMYNINKNNIKKDYLYYCELIKQLSIKLGRTPTVKDLRAHSKEMPDHRWLVDNCPDKSVKGYNSFINFIGLKPYYDISKEMATDIVLKKAKDLDYKLKISDFKNTSTVDEIGMSTINRIWGSFNNMLKELGMPINQIGRSTLEKSIEELEKDIKRLCEYLYETNGHKMISVEDVRNCKWCQSEGTYNRKFKMHFNMTLGEYISSIGYTPNKAGMGMVYEFADGEVTTSKYEYNTSLYLREKNIPYERNVKYDSFANYNGNKDCDYVINFNNKQWFIEIVGMLDYRKTSKSHEDKIRKKYKEGLNMKIELLKDIKVNYRILYPKDFYHKSLDEIFSFLYT